MTELAKKYGTVTWLGINSTNPGHRDYLQPAAHQAWAKENGIAYPILYDPTGATRASFIDRLTSTGSIYTLGYGFHLPLVLSEAGACR